MTILPSKYISPSYQNRKRREEEEGKRNEAVSVPLKRDRSCRDRTSSIFIFNQVFSFQHVFASHQTRRAQKSDIFFISNQLACWFTADVFIDTVDVGIQLGLLLPDLNDVDRATQATLPGAQTITSGLAPMVPLLPPVTPVVRLIPPPHTPWLTHITGYVLTLLVHAFIRLETKSGRILPLTYGTKYDMTQFPT